MKNASLREPPQPAVRVGRQRIRGQLPYGRDPRGKSCTVHRHPVRCSDVHRVVRGCEAIDVLHPLDAQFGHHAVGQGEESPRSEHPEVFSVGLEPLRGTGTLQLTARTPAPSSMYGKPLAISNTSSPWAAPANCVTPFHQPEGTRDLIHACERALSETEMLVRADGLRHVARL